MQTKIERLKLWRGNKFIQEKNVMDSALIINEYINSVTSLSQIKRDFDDPELRVYTSLNRHSARSFGVIAFCKITVEESLESASPQEQPILSKLNSILAQIYDDIKNNAVSNANELVENTRKLFLLPIEDIANKQQARTLIFTLYMSLNIVVATLKRLDGWKKWIVTTLVNVDAKMDELHSLMNLAEESMARLDYSIACPIANTPKINVPSTIQDFFNQRYSVLFNEDSQSLTKLNTGMSEHLSSLSELIDAKQRQAELLEQIKTVTCFQQAVKDNELLLVGRAYFMDLIHLHQSSLQLCLHNVSEDKKEKLITLMEQLKNPNLYQHLSSTILYGMSWATSLLTVTYRYAMPQSIQESAVTHGISTLDSECKAELKDLINESLVSLHQKTQAANEQLGLITRKLAQDNDVLKQLIESKSVDYFNTLLKVNQTAQEAINYYQRISISLRESRSVLGSFKKTHAILTDFIQQHDGWLVKLSNFLSYISSIFKSDMAKLIDAARALQTQLANFEMDYKQNVRKELQGIMANPDLPEVLKRSFKKEFEADLTSKAVSEPQPTKSKTEIREIINTNVTFFTSQSKKHAAENPLTRFDSLVMT